MGGYYPGHPQNVFLEGKQANVPVMVGTTKDEGNAYLDLLSFESRSEFETQVRKFLGPESNIVLAHYPGETKRELQKAASEFLTDACYVQPARQLLIGMAQLSSPVFQYQFSRGNPNQPELGAPHAIELRYVFNTLKHPEENPDCQALADKVTDYWVQFAKAGDPNREGLPEWPAYTAKNRAYLNLDVEITTGVDLKKEACDILDAATAGMYTVTPK